MKILFATTNKAKVRFYATRLFDRGIDLVTLADAEITHTVDETGTTPHENAIIKATEYAKISGLPTIAIDEGLYLDGVPDNHQPGVHVRRINGQTLNDDAMISHYIRLVNQYGTNGTLNGFFRKAVSIAYKDTVISFEDDAPRTFINQPSTVIDEGYPLASIQIISELGKYKSELTRSEESATLDIEQKPILDFICKTLHDLNLMTQ